METWVIDSCHGLSTRVKSQAMKMSKSTSCSTRSSHVLKHSKTIDKEIEKYLEASCHRIINAINTRDLEPCSDPERPTPSAWYDCCTENVTLDGEYLSLVQPSVLDHGEYTGSVTGVEMIKDVFRRLTAQYPYYHIETTALSSTVHADAAWAWSFLSMDTTGMPVGVIRQSVAALEWKNVNGSWQVSKYEGMAGPWPYSTTRGETELFAMP